MEWHKTSRNNLPPLYKSILAYYENDKVFWIVKLLRISFISMDDNEYEVGNEYGSTIIDKGNPDWWACLPDVPKSQKTIRRPVRSPVINRSELLDIRDG
jgi:hypothetical protein